MLNRYGIAAALLAVTPLGLAPVVHAQDASKPAQTQGLTEVVVTGRFIATGASSAMKLNTSVHDTPFSVAAYTESFMKAIETSTVADLYKYMTGIQRAGQTAYDMSIRGFKTGVNDRNAILMDGLPGLTGRFGSPPSMGTDHVEVVKGPASVLYGQAQPGGFVNVVTKKPLAKPFNEVFLKITSYDGDKLHLGDNNGYDVAVDTTGPIDADERFLYRFIAEKTLNLNGFRDNAFGRSVYTAPSFTWRISPTFTATVGMEYRKTTTNWDRGLVPPNKDIGRVAGITTTYQEPGDFQREDGLATTLVLTKHFENEGLWTFNFRRASNNDKSRGYDQVVVRSDLVTLGRRANGGNNARDYTFFDTSYSQPFDTGPVKHRIIVGLSGGREDGKTWRSQFFAGPATGATSLDISIYNPVYGRVLPLEALPKVNAANNNLDRDTVSDPYGLYTSDLITLSEHWKMNLGLRYANETQKIIDRYTPSNPVIVKKLSKVLPLAGIMYQPTEELTFYTSYSSSYVPAPGTAQDLNGNNPFKPESAKQVEIGSKADLFNGMVQPTVAFFRIDKKDVLSTFACPNGTCTLQLGAERAEGVEFELQARPTDNWQVALGVAHTNANVTKSTDPATTGSRITNAAKNNAHLWSRYDFKQGTMKGLGVGFGLAYASERKGTLPTSTDSRIVSLPSYSVADLGFYYAVGRYDLTFKISNLFDTKYYESSGSTPEFMVLPGAPRSVALTMRAQF